MHTDCRAAAIQLLSTIGLALSSAGCPASAGDASPTGTATAASPAPTAAASSTSAAGETPSAATASVPGTVASSLTSTATSASATPTASAPASASAAAKPSVPGGGPIKKPRTDGWVEGRPFIVQDEARLAPIVATSTWTAKPLELTLCGVSAETREALIDHFTFWALAEHASVASFGRFTLQLLSLGAPSHLVAASARAGADEIRHAELGFRFLEALGHTAAPGPLPIANALADGRTLESVFRLVVRESILGETLAAVEAAHVVPFIECAAFREELRALAEDEARHAELGFVFAAWAIGQDPSLRLALEQELAGFTLPRPRACVGVETWGVLSTEERQRVHASAHKLVIVPLCERLLAHPAEAS